MKPRKKKYFFPPVAFLLSLATNRFILKVFTIYLYLKSRSVFHLGLIPILGLMSLVLIF